tara:strand:- start:683 stop:874 length:192 start_codon:yes stop_codon:yes gene_type:complete
VIGLQEVDVMPYYKDIEESMSKMGYSDYMMEKQNGTSGTVIFYKKEKFSCVAQDKVFFDHTAN